MALTLCATARWHTCCLPWAPESCWMGCHCLSAVSLPLLGEEFAPLGFWQPFLPLRFSCSTRGVVWRSVCPRRLAGLLAAAGISTSWPPQRLCCCGALGCIQAALGEHQRPTFLKLPHPREALATRRAVVPAPTPTFPSPAFLQPLHRVFLLSSSFLQ